MNEQSDTKPPQNLENSESVGEQSEKTSEKIFANSGIICRITSYIKHWLKFQFFVKNKTVQESVNDVINEIAMFGGRPMKPEEENMIKDLLEFYDMTVDELKVPRNEILAVENGDFETVFDLMKQQKTSRIPVYKENLDNIIGFLNVKDLLLYYYEHGSLDNAESLIQEMLFVPPSMKALDLLVKMKKKRIHIATIIDEYGGTDGIITINSVISEIVGKIEDGDGDEELLIKKINENVFEVNGRAELDDLKESHGIDLYDKEYDEIETINGLILSLKHEVPEVESIIDLSKSYECVIKEVSDRMVLKVSLRRK